MSDALIGDEVTEADPQSGELRFVEFDWKNPTIQPGQIVLLTHEPAKREYIFLCAETSARATKGLLSSSLDGQLIFDQVPAIISTGNPGIQIISFELEDDAKTIIHPTYTSATISVQEASID